MRGGGGGEARIQEIRFKIRIENRDLENSISGCIFEPISGRFGLQNTALNEKSKTCIFKSRNSENANTTALLDLRSFISMTFLIFLALYLSKPSMRFLVFSVWTTIKP